jgi:hypothetical protein
MAYLINITYRDWVKKKGMLPGRDHDTDKYGYSASVLYSMWMEKLHRVTPL